MPEKTKYLFVAVPSSITPSGHKDDAIGSIQRAVKTENGTVSAFTVPDFKVGTLDALIQQSEELGRIEGQCKGVVSKVADTLNSILDGDEDQVIKHKNVNDKPLEQYLKTFTWNKVKYRADKPISELMDLLQKETNSIDNDVRTKLNQYNSIKQQSRNLQAKQTGNLDTKSLVSIVSPDMLVSNSEYLETHLLAIPNNAVKSWLAGYETMSAYVVPRSAYFIQKDSEFQLFAVTTFKKHSQEFIHKARELRYVVRDFTFKAEGRDEESKELSRVTAEEKRVWGETLRLARTGWSESVMSLLHVICLRVFVESILRYGLPLDNVTTLIKSDTKKAQKAKQGLDSAFNYLAGNAYGRDKKGRISKDSGLGQNDMMGGAAGGDAADYDAYVYYEIELD